jgi:hypothetical protein
LSIETVKKIRPQNLQGITPEEMETVEINANKNAEPEHEFVELVGQISLQSLDKNDRKKRHQPNQRPNNPRPPDPRNRR